MKILIITGGNFCETFVKTVIEQEKYSYIIAVDGGALYAKKIGVLPNLIVGDFDTLDKKVLQEYKEKGIENATYPAEKDYTDTHLAVEIALQKNPTKITIVGGTGSRLDHTLGNVGLLLLALKQNVMMEILDQNNRIYMINKEYNIQKQWVYGTYISLLPYSEVVSGITLTGFRYSLENETLSLGESRGISNELIEEEGKITVKKGVLLIIESKD